MSTKQKDTYQSIKEIGSLDNYMNVLLELNSVFDAAWNTVDTPEAVRNIIYDYKAAKYCYDGNTETNDSGINRRIPCFPNCVILPRV